MKKALLTLLMVVASLGVQADDYAYPYLAFQASDGTVTTVSVESLTMTVSNGQLVAVNSNGTQTYTLSDLSAMYFTTEVSDGVNDIKVEISDDDEVYDLQGRKMTRDQMRHGIYVIKTQSGTRKVTVK